MQRRVLNGLVGGIGGVERMVHLVIGVGYGDMLGHLLNECGCHHGQFSTHLFPTLHLLFTQFPHTI